MTHNRRRGSKADCLVPALIAAIERMTETLDRTAAAIEAVAARLEAGAAARPAGEPEEDASSCDVSASSQGDEEASMGERLGRLDCPSLEDAPPMQPDAAETNADRRLSDDIPTGEQPEVNCEMIANLAAPSPLAEGHFLPLAADSTGAPLQERPEAASLQGGLSGPIVTHPGIATGPAALAELAKSDGRDRGNVDAILRPETAPPIGSFRKTDDLRPPEEQPSTDLRPAETAATPLPSAGLAPLHSFSGDTATRSNQVEQIAIAREQLTEQKKTNQHLEKRAGGPQAVFGP